MALFAPQFQNHKLVEQLRNFSTALFYLIFICAVIPVALPKSWVHYEVVLHYTNIINVVSLVMYFVIEITVDNHLFPLAEDIRRSDFIDNSWNTAFSIENSQAYYDNDEVAPGLYKTAVNLFENAFFSSRVSKAMIMKKVVINTFFGLLVIVLGYYGFSRVPIAVPLLQVVFSTVVLGDFAKHITYVNRMESILERWQLLFHEKSFKSDPDEHRAEVYRNWLYYECTLARAQISLDSNVFNRLNQKLTHEWVNLKDKYKIN
jgi:hypothetical protein